MTARSNARSLALALALAALVVVVTGCPKKPAPAPPPPPPAAPVEEKPAPAPKTVEVPKDEDFTKQPKEPPVQAEPLDEIMRAQNENRTYLKTVYFDFDKYDLKDDTVATLKANAAWIKAHPNFRVVVEGHCDERGTIEYNLELGARRAKAVLDYLVNLGVETGRMRTISYGEERPVDPGHDEAAWVKNRRAEFTLEK